MLVAGCGFAGMAKLTALKRTHAMDYPDTFAPSRSWAKARPGGPSAEYYRIIDDAADSFARLTTYAKRHWHPRIEL